MTNLAPKYMTNMPPMRVNASDHFQTPPEALEPLWPYLDRFLKCAIWEPAAGKGNITRALCSRGHLAISTDILTGVDFLVGPPPIVNFSAIVTNPPFSLKDEFLARCYDIGKPFALLMPLTALEGQKRQALYKRHGLELLIPNRRIAFETPSGKSGKASSPQFTTAWYTWGLGIGRELTFVDLPKPDRNRVSANLFDLHPEIP